MRPDPIYTRVPARWSWLLLLGLVVAVFLVYRPVWQAGFIWDDDDHITAPALRSLHGLGRIWCDVRATLQYYPLLHSAFWVEHRLWGDSPAGYHLTNILLHALAAVLVALILRRLAIPGAYLAAAIFALHPVHVESVAWITEQKNTLSAVFYLTAMLAYLRFDRTRTAWPYLAALALFVLGLLSKTVIATLPAALLVVFWWQRGRLDWRRDVLPLVPFFLLGAAGGAITAWWELALNECRGAEFDLTSVERLLLAGRAVWFHLGKLFWPADLIFSYPRWQISQGTWWQYLFPLAVAILLAVLWAIRHWTRAPLAAVLFFCVTLLPVLGFFNLYTFKYSYVADHYQYLASLGIITLVAAGLARLLNYPNEEARHSCLANEEARHSCLDRTRQARMPVLLHLALLAALATLTWRQSRMYADAETLYRATLARNPDCWMAGNNLGFILEGSGRVDEAIEYYQQALRLKPDYVEAHYNLGNALAKQHRIDQAIEQYQQALRLNPDYAEAHCNLGNVLLAAAKPQEAIQQYYQALRLKPDSAAAHHNLAVELVKLGRVKEAVEHYNQVLRLVPDSLEVINTLAWLLAIHEPAQGGDPARAVQLAERGRALAGEENVPTLDILAAAYAAAGRFADAAATAARAVQLAEATGQKPLAKSLRVRLELYRTGRPYRETLGLPGHGKP